MINPLNYDNDGIYTRWEKIQLPTGLWVLVPVKNTIGIKPSNKREKQSEQTNIKLHYKFTTYR